MGVNLQKMDQKVAKAKSKTVTSTFTPKPKKNGKARKKYGPKDQKPKKYRGQGK